MDSTTPVYRSLLTDSAQRAESLPAALYSLSANPERAESVTSSPPISLSLGSSKIGAPSASLPPLFRTNSKRISGFSAGKRRSILNGTKYAPPQLEIAHIDERGSEAPSLQDSRTPGFSENIIVLRRGLTLQHSVSSGSSSGSGSSSASRNSSASRKRRRDEVYSYVEFVPETEDYRCKLCDKRLGKRNTTRFKKHCVEDCVYLHSPLKLQLAKTSRSKALRGPQSRSIVGLALERGEEIEIGDSTELPDSRIRMLHGKNGPQNPSDAVRNRKRLKPTKEPSMARDCSPAEAREIMNTLMETIMVTGLPFNMFDKVDGEDSALKRLLRMLHPSFVAKYLPSSQLLSGKYLDAYYKGVQNKLKARIKSSFENGYGSIIFDGWDDVNSASVVNVLLRIEASLDVGRRIYFLKSVYTGSKKIDASEYVSIIEDVMKDYGGMGRISSITSDNASSCLNARKAMTERYAGIVGINDQSHVADLLMGDMGKIPWMHEVISKVAGISRELHSHRKLKYRFATLVREYNEFLAKSRLSVSDPDSERPDPQSANTILGDTQVINPFRSDRDPALLSRPADSSELKNAVMLRQMSNTRFASAEGVLEAFLRSLPVLRALVKESDFDQLFKPRNAAHRTRRDVDFVQLINDEEFEEHTADVHSLLLLLRRYLRVFDSDCARISEVLPFTLELERNIEKLPITSFKTRERKGEVLKVFKKRKDGPLDRTVKVRLLEDVHYTALLLDPNLAPTDFGMYMNHFLNHARRFAQSQDLDPGAVDLLVKKLKLAYIAIASLWVRNKDSALEANSLQDYQGNALLWWHCGHCTIKELHDFAVRTLSCSPTSCAVERSFSVQKRLHPKERNRLSKEKVQKLIFCHWNMKVTRKLGSLNKQGFLDAVERTLGGLGVESSSDEVAAAIVATSQDRNALNDNDDSDADGIYQSSDDGSGADELNVGDVEELGQENRKADIEGEPIHANAGDRHKETSGAYD